MEGLIFSNTESILRVVFSAPLLYLFLIFITNLMGKRTTGQMNNFDWALTVGMGALLATPLTTKEISVLDGITGIVMYMLLQYIATKLAVHYEFARKAIKLTPSLLLYQGEFMETIMKKERVMAEEVYAAIRAEGYDSKACIHAVVLETDGRLSVITKNEEGEESDALRGVYGWEQVQ
jgi:uncharacterized membrane protein YcaP (DUF421 family)